MTIGQRIKYRREELKMSQDELAQAIGYKSRSSINKIEMDTRNLTQSKIKEIADALRTTPGYIMGWTTPEPPVSKAVRIPVLGDVQAGLPVTAVEDILDYEEIDKDMASRGEYFGLRIHGQSMEPRMLEGDVVIVRSQPMVENGEIAIVKVNGDMATVKKVRFTSDGLMLVPLNPTFEPIFYTAAEVAELPVRIIGKVVELRAKFL